MNRINVKRELYLTSILFIVFFSAIVLRTESTINLYAAISIFVVGIILLDFTFPRNTNWLVSFRVNVFWVWMLLLFGMYFFYGIVKTKYDYFSISYFIFMLGMIISIYLLLINVNIESLMHIFLNTTTVTAISTCIFIIFNEIDLIKYGQARIGDTASGNVNTLAVYLGTMSVPILFSLIFQKKRSLIIIYTLLIFFMLLTGSKKTFIYVGSSMALFAYFKNKFNIFKYLPYIFSLVLIVIIILRIDYLYNIIGFRILDFLGTIGFNVFYYNPSYSTEMRASMLEVGLKFFSNHPIFGNGWGYFTKYSGFATYSHNNMIELLVNYGLIGFCLYYFIYIYLLYKLIKIYKKFRSQFSVLFITLLIVIIISDFTYVSFSFNLINYLILVIIYIYLNKCKYNNNYIW